jgi:hypothetical protein
VILGGAKSKFEQGGDDRFALTKRIKFKKA